MPELESIEFAQRCRALVEGPFMVCFRAMAPVLPRTFTSTPSLLASRAAKKVVGSLLALFGVCVAGLGPSACGKTEVQRGSLMLAISTDMAAPKDVDHVGLYVRVAGRDVFGDRAPVAPNGQVSFPATIAVLAPSDPKATVRVRVVAFSGARARVMRDMTSVIPQNRTAVLRIPLSFLSYGSGAGDAPVSTRDTGVRLASSVTTQDVVTPSFDAFTGLTNRCGDGLTDVAGDCVKLEFTDEAMFDDYQPTEVFGGGTAPTATEGSNGECFPVECCFGQVQTLTPDAECRVGSLGPRTNIALLTNGVGTPTAQGTLVPLDFDADARFGEVGVGVGAGGALQLPKAVCRKSAPGTPDEERVVRVVGSTICAPKSKRLPLCGPASATKVGRCGDVIITQPDGGPNTPDAQADVDAGDPFRIEQLATGLDAPRGLAVHNGEVYVADIGPRIKRVFPRPTVAVLDTAGAGAPPGLAGFGRNGKFYLSTATQDGAGPIPIVEVGGPTRTFTPTSPPTFLGASVDAPIYLSHVNLGAPFALAYSANDTPAPVPVRSFDAGLPRPISVIPGSTLRLGMDDGTVFQCADFPACSNRGTASDAPASDGRVVGGASLGNQLFFQWIPNDAVSDARLCRITVGAGTTPATLPVAVKPLPMGNYGEPAVDAKYMYYASEGIVYAISHDGSGTPKRIAPLAPDPGYAAGVGTIFTDATYVYWIARGDGQRNIKGAVYRRRLEP
jgi:hypothetical protein